MQKHHKIGLIVFTVIASLLVSIHVFITQKAAFILKKIVEETSEGKYRLQTSSVKFSYLSEIIQATDVHIGALQRSHDHQSYALDADTIRIELKSIWPLIFKRSLNIQDIILINPSLEIRGRSEKKQTNTTDEFNLHENLLVIQNQLNKIIHELRMENFRLDNLSLKIYSDESHFFLVDRLFLHINDLFADVAGMKKPDNLELEGAIHLWLDKPNLVYPDSNLTISLDHFDWKSREHKVKIQNIAFAWRQQKEKLDSVFLTLHAVSFSNLHWAEWIRNGHFQFDSLAASAGEFYWQKLNLSTPKDSFGKKGILKLLSPISIRNFAIRELQSSVIIRTKSSPVEASLKGDSLKIQNLEIDIEKKHPVSLTSVDLAVRSFNSNGQDDKWESSFASFRVVANQVLLHDYFLKTKGKIHPEYGTSVRVPLLTMTGLSLAELTKGKLVVNELILESPFVQTASGSKSINAKKTYQPIMNDLPFLDIRSILVHNGTYVNQDPKTGFIRVDATDIYGHVYANKILRALSFQEYPNASDLLGMHHFQLNLPKAQILLENVNVIPRTQVLTITHASVKLKNQKGNIDFSNITLEVDSASRWEQDERTIFLKRLSIDSGNVDLDLVKTLINENKLQKNPRVPISVNDFSLGNVHINIRKEGRQFKSFLTHATLSNLQSANQGFKWEHAKALLNGTEWKSNEINAKISSIKIDNEQSSDFSNVQVQFKKNGQEINTFLPHLLLNWPLHQSNINNIHIPLVDVHQADVEFINDTSSQNNPPVALAKKKKGNISLEIDSVRIIQPHVHLEKKSAGNPQLMSDIRAITGSHILVLQKPDTALDIQVREAAILAGNTSFQKGDSLQVSFRKLNSEVQNIHKSGTADPLSFSIHQFAVDSLQFAREKNENKTEFKSQHIGITENIFLYLNKDSLKHTLYDSRSLVMEGTDLVLDNPSRSIRFFHLAANLPARTLGLDSFSLENKINRDSFFASQPIQKDYITIRSGAITADGVNLVKDEKDTGFTIHRMTMDHFFVQPERDMRRPPDSTFKPLLTGLIQRIPIHLAIDTLFLKNAEVVHNVIAAKSGEEGRIFFSGINGWIGNIKTFRLRDNDSLGIRVYSKLMGKGNLFLRFRESYLDSIQGFLLTARMGKFSMPELNPVLVPLTMIMITKGQIDSLWLKADANDLLGFGLMQINYHKLHVDKLDKKKRKQGFISLLANIVVRKSNHKANTIYVERLRDKSIFNYWGKIALNGLLTNIRVVRNKKNKKQYQAAIKKYQLSSKWPDDDF